MNRALLITAQPGAGKSSVLDRLSTLLGIRGVRHAAVEVDALSRGWPMASPEDWLPRLGLVCEHFRRAGRDLQALAATVEDAAPLAQVVAAVGGHDTTVLALAAPPDIAAPRVAARVAAREPDSWPGRERVRRCTVVMHL